MPIQYIVVETAKGNRFTLKTLDGRVVSSLDTTGLEGSKVKEVHDCKGLGVTVEDVAKQCQYAGSMSLLFDKIKDLKESDKDAKSELATHPAATASLKKIGYIGSPANLEDLEVKETICAVLSGLSSRGLQVYVGICNEALSTDAPVKFQEMKIADVDMFDAVIVAPGGPGARDEAKRFSGNTALFTFSNSASERGHPDWFGTLSTEATFDLKDMQADLVVEAIERESRATVGNFMKAKGRTDGASEELAAKLNKMNDRIQQAE